MARIDANGTPLTVQLLAGKYKLYLYNMGTETFPLFLQPLIADVGSNRQASFNFFQLIWFLLQRIACINCDLSHATLAFLNLEMANLTGTNLSHANLSFSSLIQANLSHANLTNANLSHTNLSVANLHEANLSYANLNRARLFGATLFDANLTGANLSGATWVDGTVCKEGSTGRCIH